MAVDRSIVFSAGLHFKSMKPRLWIPLVIVLGLAAVYSVPLFITHGEQDDCTFGPVLNAQYRDYLRRAKELSSKMPGSFTWSDREAMARFDELFEKLIDGNPSVYERVAAMHALLRSFGAQYRNTDDMRPNSYARIAERRGTLGFRYLLDVNRLGLVHPLLLQLFMRQARITATLVGPGKFYTGPVPLVAGDIRFKVQYPLFDTQLPFDRAPENCPLVPDQALAAGFSRTAK